MSRPRVHPSYLPTFDLLAGNVSSAGLVLCMQRIEVLLTPRLTKLADALRSNGHYLAQLEIFFDEGLQKFANFVFGSAPNFLKQIQ